MLPIAKPSSRDAGSSGAAGSSEEQTRAAESSRAVFRWPGRHTVRYVMLLIGCLFAIDALVGDKGLLAGIRARQQYRALEASVASARAENARLIEEARRLREDPAAIEEVARRDLGLIRPGETLFIIKDIKPPEPN
jgi:cell division protein FtsB